MAATLDWMSKEEVLNQIFNRYDTDFTGELAADQLRTLYASIRDGGISLAQVEASIEAVCAAETCDREELVDILKEMDRRYFLVRDLQWEFSMLDRENIGTITEKEARFLFQAVHDDFFSYRRWLKFLRSRTAQGSGISFAEIEVPLCNIPTMDWLDEEKQDEDKEKEDALKRKLDKEMAEEANRKAAEAKARIEKEAVRRREEVARRRAEEETARRRAEEVERIRKEKKEEEERNRRILEEDMKTLSEEEAKLREEEERLRQEEAKRLEEEYRKRREEEETNKKWKKEELLKQQQLEQERQERGK